MTASDANGTAGTGGGGGGGGIGATIVWKRDGGVATGGVLCLIFGREDLNSVMDDLIGMRGTGDWVDGFGTPFTGSACARSGGGGGGVAVDVGVGGRSRNESSGGGCGGAELENVSGGAPGGAVGTLAAAFFTSLFDDFSAPDAFSIG